MARTGSSDGPYLLECRGLVKRFPIPRRAAQRPGRSRYFNALDDVDLGIRAGESVGLVGESGCGKSTLARVLGWLYRPDQGGIYFRAQRLGGRGGAGGLAAFRQAVQMVFQDPFSSLNPRLSVQSILLEPLVIHRKAGGASARRARAEALAHSVGLAPDVLTRYPHELSGGQRQRVAIGRALALEPELLIADEPLSALDVSVQSQILNLFTDLRASRGLAYLFISHDLAAIEHLSDRVAVMYLGRIVETAARESLFAAPRHPYTRALIDAVPVLPQAGKPTPRRSLPISGEVPSAFEPPTGCAYSPRCPAVGPRCRIEAPRIRFDAGGRGLACHHPLKD